MSIYYLIFERRRGKGEEIAEKGENRRSNMIRRWLDPPPPFGRNCQPVGKRSISFFINKKKVVLFLLTGDTRRDDIALFVYTHNTANSPLHNVYLKERRWLLIGGGFFRIFFLKLAVLFSIFNILIRCAVYKRGIIYGFRIHHTIISDHKSTVEDRL